MSISKLPSGRWRAQVHAGRKGHNVSVSSILGDDYKSFATKKEAKAARHKAQELLSRQPSDTTVKEFADRWTTDPLFQRPKASTNQHNAERIKRFVDQHGNLPLRRVDDEIVSEWIAGAKNLSTVPSLRAMFNDARSAKGGRRIQVNPFAELGLRRSKGNAGKTPPSSDEVQEMLMHAGRITCPSFRAWLQVACYTGMRPGELDALKWDSVDFSSDLITVREQFSAKSKSFTLPKNGKVREVRLTPQAREALLSLPRQRFCFVNLRGNHWTPSARSHHWDRVRTKMDWLTDESRTTLYLATRHWAGWYMTNVLDLDSEIVAIQLGHEDGGELVRKLYGHRDRAAALRRVGEAYDAGTVVPLKLVAEGESA